MAKIETSFLDIGYLDTLATRSSALHRLDPRAKLITTLVFIVAVVSFGKYDVAALMPFFIYPMIMIGAGGLPISFLVKKLIIVAPFAILIGIFNPILDRQALIQIGSFHISGGWISFFSILIRFTLTISAALILIALTGFNNVCMALKKIGMPKAFVIQLMFLYRYIFVLVEEASRLVRAISLRSFDSRAMRFKTFISLLGQLLLRTMDRAQRIHLAMSCRGFNGEIHMLTPLKIGIKEIGFTMGWSIFFVAMRWSNIPLEIGTLIKDLF